MDKKKVSRILEEVGILLELKGENPFKCRAYHNAARTVAALPGDLAELVAQGGLKGVKGIGEALSEKIATLVRSGALPLHAELVASFPEGFLELLRIPGLGPRKVKALFDQLGIENIGELEYACRENRLLALEGFGAKTQQNILDGIARLRRYQGRFLYPEALQAGLALETFLAGLPEVARVSVAGSLRRCRETVKDVDLVAATDRPAEVMAAFVAHAAVREIIAHGESKSSVLLESGLQADLRCVTGAQFPYALQHFTGSREHNTALRARAKKQGLKLNEYGLFRDESLLVCGDESDLYAALGLAYIAPELREDAGEIEAAAQGRLPVLVEEADLAGVLHVHTGASDGTATLEELTEAARTLGWGYLGICDHSRSARYARGLEVHRVQEQWRQIDALNRRRGDFRLFKGIESDILADGSLDYPEEVLAGFDFVIASVHSHFELSEQEQTARILKALENPYTTMIGHLTGRLLLAREPYAIDQEAVIAAAARCGVALELNANPHRLDLDWRLLRQARQAGVKIAINPDAHSLQGLTDARYGVGIARKGWLRREDVLNCLSAEELTGFFRKARNRTDRHG